MTNEEQEIQRKLIEEEIGRELKKRDEHMRAEQKLIDYLEEHPWVGISTEPNKWILDPGTFTLKPNPDKYDNSRLNLLRSMLNR